MTVCRAKRLHDKGKVKKKPSQRRDIEFHEEILNSTVCVGKGEPVQKKSMQFGADQPDKLLPGFHFAHKDSREGRCCGH